MLSIIIMTLNAEKYIAEQLRRLSRQTLKADEIIVVDSFSDDATVSIAQAFEGVKVKIIDRAGFDHGGSRDAALRECLGDIVIFMTQDALPASARSVERLVSFLQSDENMAAAYGRQLARKHSTLYERYIRQFSYPDESFVRSEKDMIEYGIKVFNLSDVFAAYRKEAYLSLGGFESPLKTNEDMFFAARAVRNGMSIGYAADACVIHSHNFTLRQQYNRNYLIGLELERHSELLKGASAGREGVRLVVNVSLRLISGFHFASFVRFGLDCCARLLGSRMGKRQGLKEQKYAKKNTTIPLPL